MGSRKPRLGHSVWASCGGCFYPKNLPGFQKYPLYWPGSQTKGSLTVCWPLFWVLGRSRKYVSRAYLGLYTKSGNNAQGLICKAEHVQVCFFQKDSPSVLGGHCGGSLKFTIEAGHHLQQHKSCCFHVPTFAAYCSGLITSMLLYVVNPRYALCFVKTFQELLIFLALS